MQTSTPIRGPLTAAITHRLVNETIEGLGAHVGHGGLIYLNGEATHLRATFAQGEKIRWRIWNGGTYYQGTLSTTSFRDALRTVLRTLNRSRREYA